MGLAVKMRFSVHITSVHLLSLQGSVEQQIMKVVRRRTANPVNGEAGKGMYAGPCARNESRHGKLKADSIAGAIKADRQNLSVQELDLLFAAPRWDADEESAQLSADSGCTSDLDYDYNSGEYDYNSAYSAGYVNNSGAWC